MTEKRKIVAVGSGGGAKGCFPAGVYHQLDARGITFDAHYGTSVGALNAAGMAFVGAQGLKKLWHDIRGTSDVLRSNWWQLCFKTGKYSTAPLRKTLEAIAAGRTPTAEAVACYVDLLTGAIEYGYSSKPGKLSFLDAVMASASIPQSMEPVHGRYVDGGVREQTPLKQAIADGADEIYVLLCNPIKRDTLTWGGPKSVFFRDLQLGLYAIDVMSHEVYLWDVAECLRRNESGEGRRIDIHVYAPDRLDFLETTNFDPAVIREYFAKGESATEIPLTEILKELS